EGISPSPARVKAIVEYPTPLTPRQVQQFNGLANYFRPHLLHLASVYKPLYESASCKEGHKWTDAQHEAFEKVKQMLTTARVLAPFEPSLPKRIYTDASAI
ncbi:RNA-directed DNA polymerase (reverse transcriptase) domain containing protein-like protein, partial [Leptotrombidium deliense]